MYTFLRVFWRFDSNGGSKKMIETASTKFNKSETAKT